MSISFYKRFQWWWGRTCKGYQKHIWVTGELSLPIQAPLGASNVAFKPYCGKEGVGWIQIWQCILGQINELLCLSFPICKME